MQKQTASWHGLAWVALLAGNVLVAGVSTGANNKSPSQPLPSEIVIQAWQSAGAKFGRMQAKDRSLEFFGRDKDVPGARPAFRLSSPKEGVLAKLPDPQASFGLRLAGATDMDLKELAHFKNLHLLNLSFTRVTDAGLKGLAGLKNLQA